MYWCVCCLTLNYIFQVLLYSNNGFMDNDKSLKKKQNNGKNYHRQKAKEKKLINSSGVHCLFHNSPFAVYSAYVFIYRFTQNSPMH